MDQGCSATRRIVVASYTAESTNSSGEAAYRMSYPVVFGKTHSAGRANVTSQRPEKIAALLNLPKEGKLTIHVFGQGSKVRPVLFHSLRVLSHPKQYLAMLWQCLIPAPLKKGEKIIVQRLCESCLLHYKSRVRTPLCLIGIFHVVQEQEIDSEGMLSSALGHCRDHHRALPVSN